MDTSSTDVAVRGGSSGNRPNPWWAWGCSAELGPRDWANYGRFLRLMLGWAVLLVVTSIGLKVYGHALGPAAYGLALLPTAVFLLGARAYVRFLREADELTRKIHVEAMAVGFAAGLTCMLGYPVLEMAGAPALDVSDMASLPTVAGYVIGILRAQRRYR
jgi:hypothetical protein